MSNSKLWDYWSRHYENLWVQKYSLKPTRTSVIRIISSYKKDELSILDMGCGTGQLISDIKRHFPQKNLKITGVDYSKGMIQIAKSNIDYAKFILKDISQIKSLKEKFDIIISTHSLPYYKNQQKAINDLSGLLKKDGLLIIACGSENTIYDKIIFIFVKLSTGFAKYPSIKKLKSMARKNLKFVKLVKIKKNPLFPSIITMVFKKSGEN